MKPLHLALSGFMALCAALPATTHANTYFLHQDGFTDGSDISIQFEATDVNHNGIISAWEHEVSTYSVTFSGSSLLGAYSSGTQEATGTTFLIAYKEGRGFLGDDAEEAIYLVAPNGQFGYFASDIGSANAPNLEAQIFQLDLMPGNIGQTTIASHNAITVTSVPEPTSMILWSLGLLGIAATRARRRQDPGFSSADRDCR
jgi:hypothetical protein